MKFSEKWLREWVNPPVDTDELAAQLTMLGLEVDEVVAANPGFRDVVIARVESVKPHPDADRLRVCEVDNGTSDLVQIVCGAPNVRRGLVTVLANVGGQLPDGTKLRAAKLRGVESQGMLCSAAELGLSDQRDGLMELPDSAPIGDDLNQYLELLDNIIDVDLTPDRGDCLSIRGIARDLCARNDLALQLHEISPVKAVIPEDYRLQISSTSACARYVLRVVRDVDMRSETPVWMSERLRRSGVRSISPAVDITNYVMLELGQPMHAFDLDKLQGPIQVRLAGEGESLELLDGRTVTLSGDTTVIADNSGAIGIAGIMGGASTAVDENTRNILFESALFLPEQVIGKPRQYSAHTESAHRFERGVDPALQRDAMEYATGLLLNIAGGRPGPARDWQDGPRLPVAEPVVLRASRLKRILGIEPEAQAVETILDRLGIESEALDDGSGWTVRPPSYRYDIRIEEDLIEEVGRVHGIDLLPRTSPAYQPAFRPVPESEVSPLEIRQRLVQLGYQEVVTYSFVEARQQQLLRPDLTALPLANPISSDMSAMRTTLVPGLIDTLRKNQSRQQNDLRVFEVGLRFLPLAGFAAEAGAFDADQQAAESGDDPGNTDAGGAPTLSATLARAPKHRDHLDFEIDAGHGTDIQIGTSLVQQSMLAGLVVGRYQPEQWASEDRDVDFFDVKADLESLFARANGVTLDIVDCTNPMLHPGQRASLVCDGVRVGYLGRLSPDVQKSLDLSTSAVVFELSLAALSAARVPHANELSRFPGVRRDIALLVDESVSQRAIETCVREHAPDWLQDVITFDVYQGDKVDKGKKSIALGLIMQDFSRTLEESEVEQAVARIVASAQSDLGAVLRV